MAEVKLTVTPSCEHRPILRESSDDDAVSSFEHGGCVRSCEDDEGPLDIPYAGNASWCLATGKALLLSWACC
jgi:hypothetical protein